MINGLSCETYKQEGFLTGCCFRKAGGERGGLDHNICSLDTVTRPVNTIHADTAQQQRVWQVTYQGGSQASEESTV
jgi:hypothetical protein